MKFAFILAEKAHFPVRCLCTVLGVTRSGFYAWCARPVAARTHADQRLAVEVAAIHATSKRRYGSPRVHRELQAQGRAVGRHRVARLMQAQGLRAREKRRFQTTTDSRHGLPVAANLLDRQFTVTAPNLAWVTDITYLWTREGWLYLAVILDLFSRRVVGWSMSEHITRQLTLDALEAALRQRRPGAGLLHHSDRGSQYASGDYQALLAAHGLVGSMSRRANCWDNAVAESFFSTLKIELAHDADWATRADARAAVFEYLEVFYNGQRRHSALGYVSPVAFEQQHAEKALAA
jgi:transposase InsO family protein